MPVYCYTSCRNYKAMPFFSMYLYALQFVISVNCLTTLFLYVVTSKIQWTYCHIDDTSLQGDQETTIRIEPIHFTILYIELLSIHRTKEASSQCSLTDKVPRSRDHTLIEHSSDLPYGCQNHHPPTRTSLRIS